MEIDNPILVGPKISFWLVYRDSYDVMTSLDLLHYLDELYVEGKTYLIFEGLTLLGGDSCFLRDSKAVSSQTTSSLIILIRARSFSSFS